MIDTLTGIYAYNHALRLAREINELPPLVLYLLEMLKERRELNIDFALEHPIENKRIFELYKVSVLTNPKEEQLSNYIFDLDAKIRNGEIIDFIRAVSPILYRLYLRVLKGIIPELDHYIHNTKKKQYDTWLFEEMSKSRHPILKLYLLKGHDPRVTTTSLVDLLMLCPLPEEIITVISELRHLEKSVRNPLAHLIKPFDEEELCRTTSFSSQMFLAKIITLARFSGIHYDDQTFYFNQMNIIIRNLLRIENNKRESF